jgi:N-methylhydantoinase A/oxoprolinase/acetone carboxylase beta subunit
VDVGGTTTDVCMIKEGKPVLSEEGCRIGRWQTHVRAIDMYTGAGGGDSHIYCTETGRVKILPTRVQPLAVTKELADPRTWLALGRDCSLVLPVDNLEPGDDPVLLYLGNNGPATFSTLAAQTGLEGMALEKHLERLQFLQKISVAGFTPTDALHVLGRLDIGNANVAEGGAEILARACDLDIETFCTKVLRMTEEVIEQIILEYLGRAVWGDQKATPFLNNRDNELFSVQFQLKRPIIGIGAAARAFLPGVAGRLRTEVVFPELFETGNAIGAALIGMQATGQMSDS